MSRPVPISTNLTGSESIGMRARRMFRGTPQTRELERRARSAAIGDPGFLWELHSSLALSIPGVPTAGAARFTLHLPGLRAKR